MGKAKKATIKDIADLAEVSQSTVSMILNGKINTSFSEETVKKVLKCAQAINYKIRDKYSGLSPTTEGLIAVVCPTLSNPYFPALVRAIETSALEKGYNLFVCTSHHNSQLERRCLELLAGSGVCGLIFAYFPSNEDYIKELAERFPIVIVGDKMEPSELHSVSVNDFICGKILAEHLLSLGHRRLAFVTYHQPPDPPVNRLEGVRAAIDASGLKAKLVVMEPTEEITKKYLEENVEFTIGRELTLRLLEKEDVTAIIGVNDLTAYGILEALSEKGQQVPKDYSVCGFDNIFPSSLSGISLTTVERFINHKGEIAVEILLKNIGSKSQPLCPTGIFSVEYKPQLIARRTTGPCKRK